MDLKNPGINSALDSKLCNKLYSAIAKKISLSGKLTIILLIISLQVSAVSLGQKVTVSFSNAPLTKVLDELRKQTGYYFIINNEAIKQSHPVSIKAVDKELKEVLAEAFKGQPLEYSIQDKIISVKLIASEHATVPATVTVSGVVSDANNRPLPGVSIYLKNHKDEGTIADAEGRYSIRTGENSVLIFSFIGFETQEIAVRNQSTINVSMKQAVSVLGDVVITGYQTLEKQRIAGAVSKPDMGIVNSRTGTMNVILRLEGLVPGLTINNSPNATGSPVLIRGLTTRADLRNFTNPNPLYVVNGIPVDDVTSINPNDVEDITVLKDASAAAIWGSRAANGVIVISTKKGRISKPTVTYSGFVNLQGKPDLNYVPVLNSQQFIDAAKETFDPVTFPWASIVASGRPIAPHQTILYNEANGLITPEEADQQLAQLAQFNNKKQVSDLFYRKGLLMNHNLSVSGGGDRYRYYGAFGYTNAQNNTPGSANNAYALNLRQDIKFNEHVQAYVVTDLRSAVVSSPQSVNVGPNFIPYASFKNPDGSNASMPWINWGEAIRKQYETKSLISLDYNPLNELGYGSNNANTFNARVTGGLTVKLFDGLRYEGTYGISKIASKTSSLLTDQSYAVRSEVVNFTVPASTPVGSPTYYLPSTGGKRTISNANQQNWTIRNQLAYDHSWNHDMHQLTLLAGQEAQEQFINTTGSVVRGYNSDLLTYGAVDYKTLSQGISGTLNGSHYSYLSPDFYSESETTTRFTSYYATGAYSLAQKYILNASWRIDHSNLFGTDKAAQNKPVWSVGAAWQMGKEEFLKNVSWINNLAIRGSYGLTGNAPAPGTAASVDILLPSSNGIYPGGQGLLVFTPANRALTWETTKIVNFGLDFGLFNRRLFGSIDVYNKNTDNLIGVLPVNPLTGYARLNAANAGSMNNKGIEVSLNSLNISKGSFRWNTIFALGYNKNKITHLNSLFPITTGDSKISQVYLSGYSAYSVFAYQYAGLDNMGDPQIKISGDKVTKALNAAKPDDIKYMGTYQPVVSGGLANAFSYKGWGLSINLVYNMGNVMRRDVNQAYTGMILSPISGTFYGNVHSEFAERWKKPGDEATTNVPSYVASSSISNGRRNTNYYTMADINVLNASFIKCRDITLSYTFPKRITTKLLANEITLRAQLSNIMLWKANHAGIDPEFQDQGYGVRYPLTAQKSISFGANVSF